MCRAREAVQVLSLAACELAQNESSMADLIRGPSEDVTKRIDSIRSSIDEIQRTKVWHSFLETMCSVEGDSLGFGSGPGCDASEVRVDKLGGCWPTC